MAGISYVVPDLTQVLEVVDEERDERNLILNLLVVQGHHANESLTRDKDDGVTFGRDGLTLFKVFSNFALVIDILVTVNLEAAHGEWVRHLPA